MPTQMVTIQSDDGDIRAYLAIPESGRGPAVIVLAEWWGLVEHVKDVCRRFAAEGFVAMAPDLYGGRTTTRPDEAGRLMMALNIHKTDELLKETIVWLENHSAVRGKRLGVIGFCMGGQLALFSASQNSDLIGACVDFYGIHPNVQPDFSKIDCPVLGIFAEKDAYVSPDKVQKLEKQLKAAGVETEFHTYQGVDHAFFNDTRAEVYHKESAADAWAKTVEFLREHL